MCVDVLGQTLHRKYIALSSRYVDYSPCKEGKTPEKGCPGYDTKLYRMVKLLE